MHAIGALIHKHGNRRVGAGIRNIFGHFLHDEGIANDEANHLRSLVTRFFTHNRTLIKLHKQHQSCFAQSFLDCAFQFGKRACFVSRSPKFSHIRMTNGGVYASHYLIKRFGTGQTEPLYLDFSYHLEPLTHNRALIKLHKQRWSCFAQTFLDCAFQLGKNAALSEVERAPVARNDWSVRQSSQLAIEKVVCPLVCEGSRLGVVMSPSMPRERMILSRISFDYRLPLFLSSPF